MVLAPVVSPDHFLFNKSLEGPWTDIWDVGHICLTIFLGPNKSEDKHEVHERVHMYVHDKQSKGSKIPKAASQ